MLIDPFSKKLLSGNNRRQIISLMYHSVSNGNSPWCISLEQFTQQLDLLQAYGWTSVCAHQLSKPSKLPGKTVVITFDDGYANNFRAFEELIKRNMLASWFVVTNDIGKLSSWSDTDAPCAKLLDAAQLLEMQAEGMEIGSHTLSHCRLTQASNEQISIELRQSRQDLSELLDRAVTSLAYPYGLYNASILSATESAGYQVAFTTNSGFGFVNNNPLEVRRVTLMADDSLSSFARKLTFADNDVSWKKMSYYGLSRVKSRLMGVK
ncbi:MAG: polysaccharide deacetylase family protein [Methyloprofundus sp.]|nr:polysaccharide deacetylase family protein [Methyloprofundus sp.]